MPPRKKTVATTRKARTFDDAIETKSNGKALLAPSDVNEEPMQDTGMARYSNNPTFDPSDLFIPRLRLAQGLTAEVQSGIAKPGDWLVLGEEPLKSPTIIPMLMVRRRELRDTDDNRAILCRSSDSITGIGNPGGECASCPMDRWTPSKKKGGKNNAPPCTFIYSYVVYIVDTEALCVLEFYRSSMPTGKMLNTMILQKGLGHFAVQLRSNGQQGPKGTYYSPSIQPAKIKDAAFKAAQQKAAEMF